MISFSINHANIIKIPLVKRVWIRKFKIIQEAKIEFSPKLNIITGKNASGKSTVLEYLLERQHVLFLKGEELLEFQLDQEINPSCLLIDNLLDGLSSRGIRKILKKLEYSKLQVIITLNSARLKELKGKINAKIINTDEFKLKRRI